MLCNCEKRRYHLVKWDQVCKPLAYGGLFILPIKAVNKAILGKWLWGVGCNSSQGLWWRLLIEKQKLDYHGWKIPIVSSRGLGMWKSILAVKSDFDKLIQYRAHDGRLMSFQDDVWCGNLTFKQQFVEIYLFDRRLQSVIDDKFELREGKIV